MPFAIGRILRLIMRDMTAPPRRYVRLAIRQR
jgi:hypothetical protein